MSRQFCFFVLSKLLRISQVLVENISEWFSLFFLLYRCVLGFLDCSVKQKTRQQNHAWEGVFNKQLLLF